MGISCGGEDAAMAEYFLYLKDIDPGFDQMSGKAVTQAVWANLFFKPYSRTTLRMVS